MVKDHAPSDASHAQRAEALGRARQVFLHLLPHFLRHADAAARGQRFRAGRDVDGGAAHVLVAHDDHLPGVDADAEMKAPASRLPLVALRDPILQLQTKTHRLGSRSEFCQETVPQRLDHASGVAR